MEESAAAPPAALPPAAPPPPPLWPPALLPPDEDEEADFDDVAGFGLLWAGAKTLDRQRMAKRSRLARADETFIGSWPSWVSNGNSGFKSRLHWKATGSPSAERGMGAAHGRGPSRLADAGFPARGFSLA